MRASEETSELRSSGSRNQVKTEEITNPCSGTLPDGDRERREREMRQFQCISIPSNIYSRTRILSIIYRVTELLKPKCERPKKRANSGAQDQETK
jgi:hypothetical protein